MGTVAVAPEQRVWRHVNKNGPKVPGVRGRCWLWTGSLAGQGYGRIRLGGKGSKYAQAHRFIYELLVGPITPGFHVHHRCEHEACVNPRHLEQLAPKDHLLRGRTFQAHNVAKTHCKWGHAFDAANTQIRPHGGRACRACGREKYHRLKKAKAHD